MLRALAFVILLGFVLDLASMIWMGSLIGVLLTLLLLAAAVIIGVSVIRHSGLGPASVQRRAAIRGQFTTIDAGVAVLRTAAGLLFIVPGFVSDAAAIVLLLPPLTHRLARRLAPGDRAEFTADRGAARSGGVIIEADAIEISGETPGPGGDRS